MKSLFNFYLDDNDKLAITEKLERISGKKEKGQLASFLRIQVKLFLATPDEKVDRQTRYRFQQPVGFPARKGQNCGMPHQKPFKNQQ